MRNHFHSRRSRVAAGAIAIVAALAIAGGAWAYFSSSGTGQGQATGGSAPVVTLTGGSATQALYPGGAAATIPVVVNIDHDAPVGAVRVADVVKPAACSAISDSAFQAWFASTPSAPVGPVVAGTPSNTSVSVSLLESGTDQSCLENAAVTVDLVTP